MTSNLSRHWHTIQSTLFPILEEELSPLSKTHERLIAILEFVRVEQFIHSYRGLVGAPACDRAAIARAFIAKKICNIETNCQLIDRLRCDRVMRRICGWERRSEIPSESTFSRAFGEFSENELSSRLHEFFIKENHSGRLIGHISRDATAISAREVAAKKPKEEEVEKPKKRKRGRPKKGEERVKEPEDFTRLERQVGISVQEMLEDLPKKCDIGTKKIAKAIK